MDRHIFRTNDIRGRVGIDLIVEDVASFVSVLCAYYTNCGTSIGAVALGRDGRIHSPVLYEVMAEAFCACGVTVYNLGICPTPVMNFMTYQLPVEMGIMITASHNGPAYNGFKIIYNRKPLWGASLQEIADRFYTWRHDRSVVHAFTNTRSQQGTLIDRTTSNGEYCAWLVAHFSHLQYEDSITIFDCGSGATGAVIPQLIRTMNWQHASALYAEIDGTFPYHEADPTVPENMRDLRDAVVVDVCADNMISLQGRRRACSSKSAKPEGVDRRRRGFAFDGDGDRMGVVTACGRLLTGDHLIQLFTRSVLHENPGAGIVYDIKCSSAVQAAIAAGGGVAHMAPSGHAIIREYMNRHGASFGGELSCHFFFADRYFGYDDGIYAALRLFELLQQENRSLDELVDELPVTYATTEWRIPCEESDKEFLIERVLMLVRTDPAVQELSTLDGIRVVTHHGWWLLRVSNTQPVVCLRAESATEEGLFCLAEMVQKILSAEPVWQKMEPSFKAWLMCGQ